MAATNTLTMTMRQLHHILLCSTEAHLICWYTNEPPTHFGGPNGPLIRIPRGPVGQSLHCPPALVLGLLGLLHPALLLLGLGVLLSLLPAVGGWRHLLLPSALLLLGVRLLLGVVPPSCPLLPLLLLWLLVVGGFWGDWWRGWRGIRIPGHTMWRRSCPMARAVALATTTKTQLSMTKRSLRPDRQLRDTTRIVLMVV